MTFLYPAVKVIHILAIAGWFGTGIAILVFMRSEAAENQNRTVLTLIRNVQGVAAIIVVLAGIGMLILLPAWLQQGWVHTKILLWIIALGLTQISGARLKKILSGETAFTPVVANLQITALVLMALAMILVEFKPF
ncbi:MAG: hypothetical protein GXO90_01465 [FCB group bacterium]|nr:hypothetical protein [FCB group bacterium]